MNETIRNSVRLLASGTIASLLPATLANYQSVDTVHQRLIEYCDESKVQFDTWQKAWESFYESLPLCMGYKVVKSRNGSNIAYYLIGKKAVYRLVRNVNDLHLMYAINSNGNVCGIKGNYWFSDRFGTLEVLS